MVLGTDGLALISYHDDSSHDLKVAHCDDSECTSFTVNTLDSVDDVGEWTSITIGSDDLPVISYYDATNEDLKAAHCDDSECTSFTASTLDSTDSVGTYNSMSSCQELWKIPPAFNLISRLLVPTG